MWVSKRRLQSSLRMEVSETTEGPRLEKSLSFLAERLIDKYRRSHLAVRTKNKTEAELLESTWNFRTKGDVGGEGVLYLNASKGGYWLISLFSLHGRAFPVWPMAIYTLYVVGCVVPMQLLMGDYIAAGQHQNIFQGLGTSLSLVGIALFFLQTFRTNNAYARWWEGRVLWGTIVHQLVGIATTVAAGNIESRKLARRLLRWSLAYVITLKLSLRGDASLGEMRMLMAPWELKELESQKLPHRAIYSIQKMKEAWGAAQRSKVILECASRELETAIPAITIGMGGVRRIMNTPMPFAYISHLRTFLWIWISVLPFVFIYYVQYLSIAVSLVLAYSLLGMEAISLEIESPFGRDFNDLPIDNLTDDLVTVMLNAYETTNILPSPDGDDGDGSGLQWDEAIKTPELSPWISSNTVEVVTQQLIAAEMVVSEAVAEPPSSTLAHPRILSMSSRLAAVSPSAGSSSKVMPLPQPAGLAKTREQPSLKGGGT